MSTLKRSHLARLILGACIILFYLVILFVLGAFLVLDTMKNGASLQTAKAVLVLALWLTWAFPILRFISEMLERSRNRSY